MLSPDVMIPPKRRANDRPNVWSICCVRFVILTAVEDAKCLTTNFQRAVDVLYVVAGEIFCIHTVHQFFPAPPVYVYCK